MRIPFAFKGTTARHATKTNASLRRWGAACFQFSEPNITSKTLPTRNRIVRPIPTRYPPCKFTQSTVSGAVHNSRRGCSSECSSIKRKMLANSRENICGRTPQLGAEAVAPHTMNIPAM